MLRHVVPQVIKFNRATCRPDGMKRLPFLRQSRQCVCHCGPTPCRVAARRSCGPNRYTERRHLLRDAGAVSEHQPCHVRDHLTRATVGVLTLARGSPRWSSWHRQRGAEAAVRNTWYVGPYPCSIRTTRYVSWIRARCQSSQSCHFKAANFAELLLPGSQTVRSQCSEQSEIYDAG
jgi:hypothetical protein